MERIINSTIDTDTYKLTMGQAVFHNYPEVGAGFKFINRGRTPFPDGFGTKLQKQVEMMADISLQPDEEKFLREKMGHILTPDYIDWFKNYQFDPDEVKINQEGGELSIDIDGPWHRNIYWEVPLMAIISELYFQETGQLPTVDWQAKARQKAEIFKRAEAKIIEFGTRRRYSLEVHKKVLEILQAHMGPLLIGTSNVRLAMELGLSPMGTFAHEWVQAHGGIYGPLHANRKSLEVWAKEFNGKLSTALTDTFTTEVFLKDFGLDLAEIYKTFRQDSGRPEIWTDQVIDYLTYLGIDPLTRTALYSDNLNPTRVLDILAYAKGKVQVLFGIGTNITNDVGITPLNMVIKLFNIVCGDQFIPVCKLSDDPGKNSGDPKALAEAREVASINQIRRVA